MKNGMGMMKRWFVVVLLLFGVGFITEGSAVAEHDQLPTDTVVSEGTLIVINTEGQILILQKADGKKVSLEVNSESQIFLNGEPRGVDLLKEMRPGQTVVKVEHYMSDAGMQQVVKLNVSKLR
jgi:hypothetical protein